MHPSRHDPGLPELEAAARSAWHSSEHVVGAAMAIALGVSLLLICIWIGVGPVYAAVKGFKDWRADRSRANGFRAAGYVGGAVLGVVVSLWGIAILVEAAINVA